MTYRETLALSDAQVGASATAYLAGAVLGALIFGYATDRLGRKKLFFVTVGVYLTATALTAFSWNFWSYALFRALTGAGIGGEYAAINSAIDELIPARVRGRVDLIINGSYWIGAALGSAATVVLLNPYLFPVWLGWRFVFGIGAVLGLIVMFFRQWIPESPRWLIVHGRATEAEQIVARVEEAVALHSEELITAATPAIRIRARQITPWREIWETIAHKYRERSLLGFVLMVAQAFFYNAIFFTYTLVLIRFYHVAAEHVSAGSHANHGNQRAHREEQPMVSLSARQKMVRLRARYRLKSLNAQNGPQSRREEVASLNPQQPGERFTGLLRRRRLG